MDVSSFFWILIVISSSVFLWGFAVLIRYYQFYEDTSHALTPLRAFLTVGLPVILARRGYKQKSLSFSGVLGALIVGVVLTLSNFCFCSALLTFFFSSSKATKFRSQRKKLQEVDFKHGGQRNYIQVICNGGVATLLAALYILDQGCGETVIDFEKSYRSSWLCLAVLGTLCASNGDTWSSEFGSVLGSGNPRLITTFKEVPRGTNGGISFYGTVASLFGGLLVGTMYYLTLIFTVDSDLLLSAPPQWPLIVIGMLAGFIGSAVDSYLAAILQYSGYDIQKEVIVDRPNPGVEHVSGRSLLDNHAVNLVMSVIMAISTPYIGLRLWEKL